MDRVRSDVKKDGLEDGGGHSRVNVSRKRSRRRQTKAWVKKARSPSFDFCEIAKVAGWRDIAFAL